MKFLLRSRLLVTIAASIIFCSTPRAACAQQGLAIQMQLTKSPILLGEPDWVDVSVTNRSRVPVRYDMGANCPNLGVQPPLKVEVPGAEPGNGEPKPCVYSGDCLTSYPPPELAPGQTFTRRYVLSGDFRIIRPGRYDVVLEKTINYGPSPAQHSLATPFPTPDHETAELQLTLIVLPADPVRLLDIEREFAQQMTGPLDTPQKTELEQIETRNSISEGLATFPAVGMEPIFEDWMLSENPSGLAALLKLNTPDARRFIAEAGDPSPELIARWHQRIYHDGTPERMAANERAFVSWRTQAIYALGETGDKSYVALIQKLARAPNSDVRSSAIAALGNLGGEKALESLANIARHGTTFSDRQNAVGSLASTQSLTAVPILIDLITLPDLGEPGASAYALLRLTHHRVPDQPTPVETQAAWRAWWRANKKTARAYGPYDCLRSD